MNTKLSRATSEFVATRLLLVASARIIRVPASLTLGKSFPDEGVAPPPPPPSPQESHARQERDRGEAYCACARIGVPIGIRSAYFGG